MFELMEDFEPAEQFEMTEAMELAEQQQEIAHKLELNQKWYQKALSEGSTDMAGFLQKEIDELKAAQISFEGKLGAHQGVKPEDTTEDGDGSHQGKHISFGSSKIEDADKKIEKWAKDEAFHAKQVERQAAAGLDTSKSMSDLKSATKQRQEAERNREWIKAHQG